MKKLIAILLIFCLAFSGCTKESKSIQKINHTNSKIESIKEKRPIYKNPSIEESIIPQEPIIKEPTEPEEKPINYFNENITFKFDYINSEDYSGVGAEPLSDDGLITDKKIYGPKDLYAIGNLSSPSSDTTYTLQGDIDLSGKIWSPAKTLAAKIIIDGQGYSIKGLTINNIIS
jgi:hypothetical protein